MFNDVTCHLCEKEIPRGELYQRFGRDVLMRGALDKYKDTCLADRVFDVCMDCLQSGKADIDFMNELITT